MLIHLILFSYDHPHHNIVTGICSLSWTACPCS